VTFAEAAVKDLDQRHPLYGRKQRLDDEEIVRLYAELRDSEKVGLEAGCSGTTVLNRVRAAGGEVFPRGHRRGGRRVFPRLPDEEIVRLYRDEAISGPRLADIARCSVRHIYDLLDAAGIPRRRPHDYWAALNEARKKSGRGP